MISSEKKALLEKIDSYIAESNFVTQEDLLAKKMLDWIRDIVSQVKEERVKPKKGESYYFPSYSHGIWGVTNDIWINHAADDATFEAGDVYLTREACEARVEELKKMMKGV